MQAPNIQSLSTQVLLAAFFISFVFGAIAQRTHFCTMGALSDVFTMGDTTRLRQWAMAAGVAMLGFAALVYSGSIDPSKTLYASGRLAWLSALVGGAMFGFGMVLASGCGSKTLVRLGAGNLKSLVVFVIMGVAAFATLKGVTAVLRVATVDAVAINLRAPGDLPTLASELFGMQTGLLRSLLAGLLGGGLVLWALLGKGFARFDNLLAGLGIGALVVLAWWASGSLGYVAEHPDTLQEAFLATNSGRSEALSFVAPAAYLLDWLMFFSDKSKLLSVGIVSVLGVVAGSALWALATGNFRWEGFASTEDLANHMVGAVLMGVGGVTAMGCSVGQGLSGLSTLSATSFIAVSALSAGALAAFRYQTWRIA